MKYFLSLLMVVLAACSDSNVEQEKLEKTVEKELAAAAKRYAEEQSAKSLQIQQGQTSAANKTEAENLAESKDIREDLRPENIPYFNEKVDVQLIGTALEKAGARDWQGKEQEWNRRLETAKNNAEIQAVIAEQLGMYRKGAEKLSGLNMRTDKGRIVHDKLYRGFKEGMDVLNILQKLDLASAEGQVQMRELNPDIQRSGRNVMEGMQLWISLMKDVGYKLNAENEAKFQSEIKRMEKMLQ